ncbi:MAG: NifU family protein [Bacteroidota bacterium]
MKNDKAVLEKINKAFDNVRPYLQSDGGDIELVEVTDDMVIKVRLLGACDGCPFSVQTLKAGIEQALRRELPEMKELVAV